MLLNIDVTNCFLNLFLKYKQAFSSVSTATLLSLMNPQGEWRDVETADDRDVRGYCQQFVSEGHLDAIVPVVLYLQDHPYATYNTKWFCNTKAPKALEGDAMIVDFFPMSSLVNDPVLMNSNNISNSISNNNSNNSTTTSITTTTVVDPGSLWGQNISEFLAKD